MLCRLRRPWEARRGPHHAVAKTSQRHGNVNPDTKTKRVEWFFRSCCSVSKLRCSHTGAVQICPLGDSTPHKLRVSRCVCLTLQDVAKQCSSGDGPRFTSALWWSSLFIISLAPFRAANQSAVPPSSSWALVKAFSSRILDTESSVLQRCVTKIFLCASHVQSCTPEGSRDRAIKLRGSHRNTS